MTIDNIIPFITFIIFASITPGPNNLLSATLGINYGYKTAVRFIFGVYLGIFMMLLLTGLIIDKVNLYFPKLYLLMKYVSLAYLLYMIFMILRINSKKVIKVRPENLILKGFILQVVNPKAYIFCTTIYTVFIVNMVESKWKIFFVAVLLPIVTFLSTTAWSLFGTAAGKLFKNKRYVLCFNALMIFLLLFVFLRDFIT